MREVRSPSSKSVKIVVWQFVLLDKYYEPILSKDNDLLDFSIFRLKTLLSVVARDLVGVINSVPLPDDLGKELSDFAVGC